MQVIVNFVLFQLAWFACVLGAANGLPWVGPLVVTVVAAYHLLRVPEPRAEMILLLVVALIGLAFDSMLVASGWLVYSSGQWHPLMAPYWIVAMWVAFATTFNVSMHWLKGRALMAILFGAAGGPLAYLAGAKLGAVVIADPLAATLALGLGWGLLMPVLMWVATHFDGWRPGVGRRVLAARTGAHGNV